MKKSIRYIVMLVISLLSSHVVMAAGVTGAGASFPAPVYAQWADAYYQATGIRVNYQSVGSSAGVNQIRNRTVDFGASDAPLSDEQLAEYGLIQFPTVIGGVVPVVNIQGLKPGELKLNGDVLARIYMGEISNWNDPAITALNPGLSLPNAKIAVIRRSDGSGTSYAFTQFLSATSPEWSQKVGAGTAVNWPVGAGGKGNEGVSAYVMQLPNSIGYVEYAYAKQMGMSYVLLENASGNFVAPDETTFKAAAAGIDWAKSFSQNLVYASGEQAWPIATATFILIYQQAQNPEQTREVLRFFDWAYRYGDQYAQQLDYVTFPQEVKDIIRASWRVVTDPQGQVIVTAN